jgi:hypothetical protein
VLLTRPPLTPKGSFDLHVLGTPPAFILSQDQTLQMKMRLGRKLFLILRQKKYCPTSYLVKGLTLVPTRKWDFCFILKVNDGYTALLKFQRSTLNFCQTKNSRPDWSLFQVDLTISRLWQLYLIQHLGVN